MQSHAAIDLPFQTVRPTGIGPQMLADKSLDGGAIRNFVKPGKIGAQHGWAIGYSVGFQTGRRHRLKPHAQPGPLVVKKQYLRMKPVEADTAWITRFAEVEKGIVRPHRDLETRVCHGIPVARGQRGIGLI